MRIYCTLLVALAVGLGLGCKKEEAASTVPAPAPKAAAEPVAAAKPDTTVFARVHFSGTTQLLADTNSAKLNEIAALPETVALQDQILSKLATTPYRLWQQRIAGGTNDYAASLRPLLDDLLHNESYLELRHPTNDLPDLLLAIHLSNERAELWQTNLATVLGAWTGLTINPIQTEGYSGWELKKHDDPNLIRFLRAGDWVVVGWGQDEISGQPALLQRIKAQGRPAEAAQGNWLDAWVDWPAALAQHPVSVPFKLPKMQLTLGVKGDNVRTKAVFQFPEPLNLTVPEWNVPTNIIRDPLIQFTAVRGLSPWLSQLPFVQGMNIDPWPEQFYSWAMSTVVFESYLAAPVAEPTNYLEKAGSQLISEVNSNLAGKELGQLAWNTNHTAVEWTGMQLLSPTLRAVDHTNGDFVLAGIFPGPPRREPAPPELFNQILGRTNLLYYDWEITGERVGQWRNLVVVYYLLNKEPISDPKAPVQEWISALKTKVGNSVTELEVTKPDELTLVRKSPLGLTSMEIGLLARWVDAPGFPFDTKYVSSIPEHILKARRDQSHAAPLAPVPAPLPPAN